MSSTVAILVACVVAAAIAQPLPSSSVAPTTTKLTTTAATTTTTIQADQAEKFSCANKMDDVYASELNKCSSVFWTCSSGNAHMHMCPSGLMFDIVSKTCLASDFITSCGGQATTTVSQTTKAPINDPIFATACMSLPAGYYNDPRQQFKTANGTCSQLFMVCTGAPSAAVYQCPSDLYYDSSITACNYRAETTGCTGVAPASTTPIPTQVVMDAPQGTCDGKMSGNFDLKNGTCAHEYVACSKDGRGWIFTCPSDLYFDVEYNRCEYKDFIPICSGSPRPDSATTTTTIAATTVAPVVRRR